jgi:hypothetical protein
MGFVSATIDQVPLSSPNERMYAGLGAAAMAAGVAAVWYFEPSTAGFFPACPLYSMTGFACPGCGMTRGFHAMFHGDIVGALDFNALIPLVAIFFGYWFLSLVLTAFRGRGFGFGKMSAGLVGSTFFLLLVFGIVRNIPAYPFTILFP